MGDNPKCQLVQRLCFFQIAFAPGRVHPNLLHKAARLRLQVKMSVHAVDLSRLTAAAALASSRTICATGSISVISATLFPACQ